MQSPRTRIQSAIAATAIAACVVAPSPAWADITVDFTPPELEEGMESLESMLDAEAEPFLDGIVDLAEEALYKPLFLAAFGGASSAISLLNAPPIRGGLSFSLGASVAAWASSFSADTLATLSAMSAETDLEAGLAAQPIVLRAAAPIKRLPFGLIVDARLGYAKLDGASFALESFSAGIGAKATIFGDERPTDRPLRFHGVTLSLGADYASGSIGATIEPGPIYRTVSVDPDGEGPLLGLSARILVDPSLEVAIGATSLCASAGAFTGLTAFSALGVRLGGGAALRLSSSSIGVEADEAVVVDGYLGDLVVQDGAIVISGDVAGEGAIELAPFVAASLEFSVGSFDLRIPIAWYVPKGLALGVYAAVRPW